MRHFPIFLLCAAAALPLAAAINGAVVNPDGTAISDVQVQALRPLPARSFREHRDPLATARTGSDGKFALDVSGYGFVEIHIQKEGYAPAAVLVATDESAATIALRRAESIQATVTANGKPVANANVYIMAGTDRAPFITKTDADGKYRVPNPRLWEQTIVVQHPDFAPAWHPSSSPDFTLTKGDDVHGTVTDADGHPAAGVAVDLGDMISAKTDGEGKFTLANVPRQAGVFLRARGNSAIAFVPLAAGTPTVKLRPAARISGVVRDAERHPLAGAPIAIIGEGFEDTAVTDSNGAYAIEAPRGTYAIESLAPSFQFGDAAEKIDATAGNVKKDLIATRQQGIEGLVRTADGKSVAGSAIGFLYEIQGMSWFQPTENVTGPDGSFRVYAARDGGQRTRLVAVAPGMPPAISEPIVASDRGKRVTITVPKGTVITGKVIRKDGKAIAGVRVDPVIGTQRMPQMEAILTPTGAPWATTDQEGRFTGRLTEATSGLSFAKKGYVTADQVVNLSEKSKVEVMLAEAGSIAGRVVNKDGSPASDIMISAASAFAMSSSDGSFVVEGLEPGPQVVRFGRGGIQQQTVDVPTRDLVLVLGATRAIHGRVIDAASGAPVERFSIGGSGADDYSMPTLFDSPTGEFKVDVPAKAAKIAIQALGYVPANDVAVDPAGDAAVTIKLSRGRTLRGRVLDEKQQPIAGVEIGFNEAARIRNEEEPPVTRADGSFELPGLPFDEAVNVQFQKGGYLRAGRKIKAGHDDESVEVTLRRGIAVTGHVVDRSGAGIPNVEITASSAAPGAEYENAQTDASGAFRFDSLAPAARYDFLASRTDTGERGTIKDVDIENRHDLTIQLNRVPTGTIFGHVTGLTGSSTNRFVSVLPTDAEGATAPIDNSGNFRAENVPAGTVEVVAQTYGARTSRTSKKVIVDVAAGSESRVDLEFPAQVTIHGRVLRGSEPIAGAAIAFYGSQSANAVTGADGTYEASMATGDYDVTLSGSDTKPLPFAQRIAVSDAAEFDFRFDAITLNATVLDAETGQPINGAALSISRRGETHTLATGVTGADGSTALEVSRGEPLTAVASKSGYANASDDATSSASRSIVLRLARTPGALVRIVDVRNGSTLAGYVIARDASGRVVASANETDPDGTVTLPIAPGKYLFSASAEGFGSHTVSGEVPSGEIRVPLPRGGNLSIRSNTDVRGTARLIQPNGEEYVRCWCSGIAEIKIDSRATLVDRISPGGYVLEVKLAEGKTKRLPVSIIEGQTAIVSID
ncbi:MAG TPA: carboxypeptidase regulatory-like domain-containing protein [Thermoanaerobaculia bacterium]